MEDDKIASEMRNEKTRNAIPKNEIVSQEIIHQINGKYSYHLEAQIEKDENIVFRIFEYSSGHALRTRIREDGNMY